MTKKGCLILAAVGIGCGLAGVALTLLLFFGPFSGFADRTSLDPTKPVYLVEQSASSHPGYRHSTATCGSEVYVNDYEEAGLELANPEPTTVIGHLGPMGVVNVCSIEGQPTTAYIACDDGSEMPAYVPYRNIKQRPFDWRTAAFREMKAFGADKSGPSITSTDAALIAEVVRTLRDGTPVELPSFPFAKIPSLGAIKMTSDQLPGLLFCPLVFTDANGQIYVAESTMLDATSTPMQVKARWIPASPTLARWLKGL
jgi:hypothetical protein